jgi:hypothetical protein
LRLIAACPCITTVNSSYLGLRIVNVTHDLVYTEFFSNATGLAQATLLPEVPLEVEVFNRLRDPWQVSNLWGHWKASAPATLAELHWRLRAHYASVSPPPPNPTSTLLRTAVQAPSLR